MFFTIIHIAWLIIQAFIGFNVLLPCLLYLVYGICKLAKKQSLPDEELHEEKDYAIIVSVQEQTTALSSLLSSLLQLNYTNYLVYVVVNNGNIINMPSSDKIVVVRTAKTFQNNNHLHRFVIENFRRSHTHLTFLSSTSVIGSEYLNKLNVCFHQGYQAVQSMYAAKNSISLYDIIQSAGNAYRCFFMGELPFTIGSSATLARSGTAFTVSLYKQCLKVIPASDTGFIKALQQAIIERGYQVAFARDAVVYNDRTINGRQLLQQHAHNINLLFKRFAAHSRLISIGISSASANQFLYGMLSLQLPMFTGFLAVLFCLLSHVWLSLDTAALWAGFLLLFPLCNLIAAAHVTAYHYNPETMATDENDIPVFPAISLHEKTTGNGYNTIAQTV